MSKIAKTPGNIKRPGAKIIVAGISVLVLLLIYGAGTIVLPISILSRYHARDCGSTLSINGLYTRIYPAFIQDLSIAPQVGECDGYMLAVSNEEMGNWEDAYTAYQEYSTTYPVGLYLVEAHEHGAIVLLNMAKDMAEQQDYEKAIANLHLIASSYSDTGVSADALAFSPSVYTAWGASLREMADFEKAEQVFIEFKTWSQSNQQAEAETEANSELARTYMDWGLALQSEKQFEGSIAKFDLAASADPQSGSNSEQARQAQRRVYIDWGNDLLEQGEFSAAIETFKLGVSKSDGNNEDGVNDALANGYIQWAHNFSADEDFEGALEQLAAAGQAAVSDSMKKSVDIALDDTYLEFSKSSGDQARRAMRAALISICDKNKKPDLPIFGLNEDSIRFGIYDVDVQLPEDLAAQTPGEMHYVACVDEINHTVESRFHRVILLRFSGGYYYKVIQQFRAEILWDISLLKTATLENIGEMTFTGGTPPPFSDSDGAYFFGPPPEMEDVGNWLESVVE